MQTVNISDNKFVEEFINRVNKNDILPNDIFLLLSQIIDFECKKYSINPEIKNGIDENLLFGCDYSNDKDIVFYINSDKYYKKYFEGNKEKDNYNTYLKILFETYCKIGYAVDLMELNKSNLSLRTLNIAREYFAIKSYGEKFLKDNIEKLYSNYYAIQFACSKLNSKFNLNLIKEDIDKSAIYFMVGKILYEDNYFSKRNFLDKIYSENLNEIENWLYKLPILSRKYTVDGFKKKVDNLFDDMNEELKKISYHTAFYEEDTSKLPKEYFECKEFYYDLILSALDDATEEDYDNLIKKYGVINIQRFFIDMEKYFNAKFQKRLTYVDKISSLDVQGLEEVKDDIKNDINAIVRFRNGVRFNLIAEKLLREGGFIRGTRENLTKEELKRREYFANSLVNVYDIVESESDYKARAENEKSDIDEVVNAMYYNRFEDIFNNIELKEGEELENKQVIRVAQIIKIVKIISNTIKVDCLEDFLTIPDINKLIIKFEKDDTGFLKECIFKTKIRFKKVIYPETEAENGKFRDYILGNEVIDQNEEIGIKINMVKEEIMNKVKK